MERPKHKLEGNESIFVRFRSGFRLFIKNNIKEILLNLLQKLENNPNHTGIFRAEVKDIADGSGAGIHPDSTWQSLVKEIFDSYERSREPIDQNTKKLLLKLLSLIADKRSIEQKWDEIKSFILQNINELSGWTRIEKYKSSSFFGDIKRDKDGNYYMIEKGRRIEVMGTVKTHQEEHFEYITDDAIGNYGRLGGIIRLIALVDIGEQYKTHPEHFSKRMICDLPDNDYQSAYLHWKWYVWGAYDFVPAFWRPRSCYSDPQWLSFDLIAMFSEGQEIHKDFPPQLTDEGDFQRFQQAFAGYPLQYELALETDLYLGNETDVYFDFEGRKIRWINGTRFVTPTLSVPSRDPNYEDAVKITKRFLSVLVKEAHISIVELSSAGAPARFNPLIRQPRTMGGLGLDPRYLLPDGIDKYSVKKWIGLALYKEGVNSKSIYYSFLSFFKVIQLAFRKNDKDDDNAVMDWIDNNIDQITGNINPSWKTEVLKRGQKAGNYLYGSGRCAVAHVQHEKGKINNPDDNADHLRIDRDLRVIRALADRVLDQNLL